MSDTTVIHDRLQNEFPFFARHALKIEDKDGQLIPFILNTAQKYLYDRIQRQIERTGWVRILILKGRQQGMSTFVSGYYYHGATRKGGKKVFILSHEANTTDMLFQMVDRYQKNIPLPLKPHTGLYNTRQIEFDTIGSRYRTGTAGNDKVGRGGTLQFFHGSEVAFWEKTDGLETGVLQSVASNKGTSIILESTANGMGNMFYDKCMDAIDLNEQGIPKKGDFELVFIPWFWQTEYRRELDDNFECCDEEEEELKKNFELDDEQIYWRRKKIEELKSHWKFRQEYPMTVMDAFVATGASLMKKDYIIRASKASISDPSAPLILGVDTGKKNDRAVIAWRRGREVPKVLSIDPKTDGEIDLMHIVGVIATSIKNEGVVKVFMDNAMAYGIIDRLKELGYKGIVQGVSFSERAIEKDVYLNKRAEIYCLLADWIHEGGCSIPDEPKVQLDLAVIPDFKLTSSGKKKIRSKDEIKDLLGRSPDITDAIALTFAYPVANNLGIPKVVKNNQKQGENKSPLRTLSRFRKKPTKDGTNLSMGIKIF